MPNTISLQQLSAATLVGRRVPNQSWHPSAYRISVWSSLMAAVAIGLFLIALSGARGGGPAHTPCYGTS